MKETKILQKTIKSSDEHSGLRKNIITLSDILSNFLLIRDVYSAFIIDIDGLLVGGLGMTQREMENIGVLIYITWDFLSEIGDESKTGRFIQSILSFSGGKIFCGSLSASFFYVVIGKNEAPNEKVDLMLQRYKKPILTLLSGKRVTKEDLLPLI